MQKNYFESGHEIFWNDKKIVVEKFLAEGSSGKVYQVHVEGNTYALKWIDNGYLTEDKKYYYHCKQIMCLRFDDNFVFLFGITEYSKKGFGLLMPIIDRNQYYSLHDVLLGKTSVKSYKTLITIAINFIISIDKLHSEGYCYVDMIPHNIFINPESGKLNICDCDSICSFGDSIFDNYMYKPKYQAPEIIIREKKRSIYSDR